MRQTPYHREQIRRGNPERATIRMRKCCRATAGPPMGQGVEPQVIRLLLGRRLPRRQGYAHQPRSHLPGAIRPEPRRAAVRADGVPANRTGPANAAGANAQSGQSPPDSRHHDQPASGRRRRSCSSRPLGRRPHHWPRQLSDWHPRRTHDTLYNAASPSADGRACKLDAGKEWTADGRPRCRSSSRCHCGHHRHLAR